MTRKKRPSLLRAAIVLAALAAPVAAWADASAILRIKNDSSVKLKANLRQEGEYTDMKTVRSGDSERYEFSFGSCGHEKNREFEIQKPPSTSSGAYVTVVEGTITIVAERESGECRATLTFNSCDDNPNDAFKPSCSNKTRRIGLVTIVDK